MIFMIIASAHHICDFTTSNFAKIRPKLHPNHSATTQNLRHCRRAAQIVKPASSTLWRVCICTGGKLQCHWIAIISSWICDLGRGRRQQWDITLVTKHRAAHLARTPLSPLITSSTLAIGHDTILLEQGKPPAFLSPVFANYKYFWLKIVRQSHLPLLCPSIRKLCMNPPLSVRRGWWWWDENVGALPHDLCRLSLPRSAIEDWISKEILAVHFTPAQAQAAWPWLRGSNAIQQKCHLFWKYRNQIS